MPGSERDKRLRAELAAELGWYPADLDDESIARHRADAARKKTDRDPAKKWAHLTELARQRDVEGVGLAAAAANGRKGGRPERSTTRMPRKLATCGIRASRPQTSRTSGVSRATVYRYLSDSTA